MWDGFKGLILLALVIVVSPMTWTLTTTAEVKLRLLL
jgi:hypothetical protein